MAIANATENNTWGNDLPRRPLETTKGSDLWPKSASTVSSNMRSIKAKSRRLNPGIVMKFDHLIERSKTLVFDRKKALPALLDFSRV